MSFYTPLEKALMFIIFLILSVVVAGRADDTELRATISRVSLTHPDPMSEMQKQIQELIDQGFELTWTDPRDERGFVWVKHGAMPWIKVHAKLSEEESSAIRRILSL